MKKIIELKDVTFSYQNQKILKNITFDVYEKDFMAILGPNGGGKTTLLKLLLGLLKPDSGTIKILSQTPSKARRLIGYVPQFAILDKDFPIMVKDVVLMRTLSTRSIFPFYAKNLETKVFSLLKSLRIYDIAYKKFGELSGGQKQRAMIARALITDPLILFLDEPMASLDPNIEEDIYNLLKKINKEKTILFVTHDIGVVSTYVNKITCLNVNSCTHTSKELSEEDLLTMYHGTIQKLQHKCKL